MGRVRSHFAVWLAALALAMGAKSAGAGGGPENVVLVVNSASWASQTVANHFIQLRQIPPVNVVYVDWHGGFESVSADDFRQKILGPVLETIERRGMLAQTDYVVYSSDFPYVVDLTRDFEGQQLPQQLPPVASINAATYFWNFLFAKHPLIIDLQANRYMRAASNRAVQAPSHGFRSWYGWGSGGELQDAGGQPYMLSMVLAATSGRGNSVSEAIKCLQTAATADGTRPKGTIYFSDTEDVRSKARKDMFPPAISELKQLGVSATIIKEALPTGRRDVQGLLTGTPEFSWRAARSTIRPGAICENFTSYGGILNETFGQTTLAEFLRYGAAGASGTVVEPYAIHTKFPSPLVQVHYARGCTLAEAFYQSLWGPAQLLIVGDPLCRPWADIPKVTVTGVPAGGKVTGTLTLQGQATSPGSAAIDHFELFVDGRRSSEARPGAPLVWDSTTEADGYHELRVVAVAAGPIETQGRAIVPVTVNNRGHAITLAVTPAKSARWGEIVTAKFDAPGMAQVMLLANMRALGTSAQGAGEIKFDPQTLGSGPVVLQAVGTTAGTPRERVWSTPVPLAIEPAAPLPPVAGTPSNLGRGIVVQLPDGKIQRVEATIDPDWLSKAGVDFNKPLVVQGFFDVDAPDVYQFQVAHSGALRVIVDGHAVYNTTKGDGGLQFVPVSLARGTHRLSLSGTSGPDSKLRVLFGGQGTRSISSEHFRHAR